MVGSAEVYLRPHDSTRRPNVKPSRRWSPRGPGFDGAVLALSPLPHECDLAADVGTAFGLDEEDVAAARDQGAVAVPPVPHELVEPRAAARGRARERLLEHQVARCRENAQGHG